MIYSVLRQLLIVCYWSFLIKVRYLLYSIFFTHWFSILLRACGTQTPSSVKLFLFDYNMLVLKLVLSFLIWVFMDTVSLYICNSSSNFSFQFRFQLFSWLIVYFNETLLHIKVKYKIVPHRFCFSIRLKKLRNLHML